MSEEKVEQMIRSLRRSPDAEAHNRILGHLLGVLKEHKRQRPAALEPELRRTIMRSPITKLAAAAVVFR